MSTEGMIPSFKASHRFSSMHENRVSEQAVAGYLRWVGREDVLQAYAAPHLHTPVLRTGLRPSHDARRIHTIH